MEKSLFTLKTARERKGLKQVEAAKLIGVSVDMVSVGPNRAQTIVRRNVF